MQPVHCGHGAGTAANFGLGLDSQNPNPTQSGPSAFLREPRSEPHAHTTETQSGFHAPLREIQSEPYAPLHPAAHSTPQFMGVGSGCLSASWNYNPVLALYLAGPHRPVQSCQPRTRKTRGPVHGHRVIYPFQRDRSFNQVADKMEESPQLRDEGILTLTTQRTVQRRTPWQRPLTQRPSIVRSTGIHQIALSSMWTDTLPASRGKPARH